VPLGRPPAPTPRARPSRVLLALLAVVMVVGLAGPAAPVGAAEADAGRAGSGRAPIVQQGDELGNSLPRPNSGHEPTHAGDRGGSAQRVLFGVLLAGTAFIAVMVVRQVRRTRRAVTT